MIINVLWETVTFILIMIVCIRTVPFRRIREAVANFLIMQVITWGLGTVIVEFKWKVHPVRMFPEITRQDFMNDYFIYPLVSVLFYFYYPRDNTRNAKIGYTLAWAGAIGLWDFGMDMLTELEQYVHWNAMIHFMLSFLALLACNGFTHWFFKHPFPTKQKVESYGQK
ncbi:MAG: hypothetical protein K0R75_1495 [Paenibacillaceae bacterium]|nr:hypothetical protein [Paenibacillaceae bacterium]